MIVDGVGSYRVRRHGSTFRPGDAATPLARESESYYTLLRRDSSNA